MLGDGPIDLLGLCPMVSDGMGIPIQQRRLQAPRVVPQHRQGFLLGLRRVILFEMEVGENQMGTGVFRKEMDGLAQSLLADLRSAFDDLKDPKIQMNRRNAGVFLQDVGEEGSSLVEAPLGQCQPAIEVSRRQIAGTSF